MKVKITFGQIMLCIVFLNLLSCKSLVPGSSDTEASVGQMDKKEYTEVNSILQKGLDREALYTILDNLKPMSSLVVRSYPVANDDSLRKISGNIVSVSDEKYLDSIAFIQNALNKINLPDLKFVIVPYKSNGGKKLLLQLSVVRISRLNQLLSDKKSFFGQFGLVPGADPYLVLSTIENADKLERFRGYGYLFGYPEYAVDFFVNASLISETSKRIEPRKFFQIPAYAGEKGYFVYAYPDSLKPTSSVDSVLYHKAVKTLDHYKMIRSQYLNKDSSLNALQMLYSEIKRQKKN